VKGLDEFLLLFGDITISQIVTFVMAIIFIIFLCKQAKKYFNEKIKVQNEREQAEKKKDEELKEALSAVRKYPEYRQQSIKIQELLEGQIQDTRQQAIKMQELLEEEIQELRALIQDDKQRLIHMEEQEKRRECNKLRDMLLQNYRYYTNKEQNPSQSWTVMESEAFWELFRDYEDLGGNGYMHTEVLPAMERLIIVDARKK
jgi:hypothetical protein